MSTVISCEACGTQLIDATACECGWSKSGGRPKPYVLRETAMTREQFGQDLWDALRTIGGIAGDLIGSEIAVRRAKPGDLKAWQEKRRDLVAQLPALLGKLSVHDLVEVTRRYPWVTGL